MNELTIRRKTQESVDMLIHKHHNQKVEKKRNLIYFRHNEKQETLGPHRSPEQQPQWDQLYGVITKYLDVVKYILYKKSFKFF